jgi:hypothetical protein
LIPIFEGESISITANLFGFEFFTVPLGTPDFITNVNSHAVLNFDATVAKYSIGGRVLKDGEPMENIEVSLIVNSGTPTIRQTTVLGEFSFDDIEHGSHIIITPTLIGHHFVSTQHIPSQLFFDMTNIIFNAHRLPRTIQGTVRLQGDPLPGVTIFDVNENGDPVISQSDGTYIFECLYGDEVELKAIMFGYSFLPESIYISSVTSNLSNRNFDATAIVYDVGFSIPPGTYFEPISVILSTATDSATIFYTLDGSLPTSASIEYIAPILIPNNSERFIRAIATKPLYQNSAESAGLFRVTGKSIMPTIHVATGTYNTHLRVEITTVGDYNIYYTTDGTDPKFEPKYLYTDRVFINKNSILRAVAGKSDYYSVEGTIAESRYQINHILSINPEIISPINVYMNERTENENSQLTINLSSFIRSSVEGDHLFTATLLNSPTNLHVNVAGSFANIIPNFRWNGEENLVFKMEYIPTPLSPFSPPTSEFNNIVLTVNTVVHPNQLPYYVRDFFPQNDNIFIEIGKEYEFFLNTAPSNDIRFEWFVNETDQDNNTNFLRYIFSKNENTVRVVVFYETLRWQKTWTANAVVSEIDSTIITNNTLLLTNFPNPFNPETSIQFALAFGEGRGEGHVNINVFNVRGQLVANIVEGRYHAGTHTIKWNATGHGSGIYFVVLKTENTQIVHKMILLK